MSRYAVEVETMDMEQQGGNELIATENRVSGGLCDDRSGGGVIDHV